MNAFPRIPVVPPRISALYDDHDRPLWSVMIPAYNCSRYLSEAIQSVLMQDPGPLKMQIEVVDDASTDADVEALVLNAGGGRVSYYRQRENVGSLRNFETCLNRARGYYIHLLHGDDYIREGFYREIEMLFHQFPACGAAFTGYSYVDESGKRLYDHRDLPDKPGILENWVEKIAGAQLIQPPAMVVKRMVYEKLGSFYAVHYGEDWEMWVRIAASFPVAHSPANLAFYRVHKENITSRSFISGQSLRDAVKVMELIGAFLPVKRRQKILRAARRHVGHYFARSADKIYHEYHKPLVAQAQAKAAMNIYFSRITLYYWTKIRLKILLRYKMDEHI